MRKFKAFLIVITVLLLSSACDHFFSDIERDLEYWSSTVLITGNEIPAAGTDNEGYPCLPSAEDKTIILKLTNPQKYILKIPGAQGSPSDIVVFESGVKGADGKSLPKAEVDYEFKQKDSEHAELIYKEAFLKYSEWGSQNLSPTITLYNKEGRKFEQKYTFKLRANTPPPKPKEIVLAKTKGSDSRYVLCLQFDSAEMTRKIGTTTVPIHKDIAKITINDSSYTLLYKEDNSDFQKPAETFSIGSFIESGNVEILDSSSPDVPSGWVLYFKTGIQVQSTNPQTSYTITLSDNKGVVSDVFTADLKKKFKVTFNSQDGSPVPAQYIENNGKVTRPTDPTKTGYIFGGWYKDADCFDGQKWDFATDTVTSDITLYAKWVPGNGTPYMVEHYQQNVENNSYTLAGTETKYGTTGGAINANDIKKEYQGFDYVSMDPDPATIAADGNTVVKLYYNRKTYNVTFSVDGSNGSISATNVIGGTGSTSPVTVKYDGSITFTATPNFGWEVDSWTGVTTAPPNNTTATLTVNAHTDVTVKFKKKKTVNSSDYNAWKLLKKVVEIADDHATITIDGKIKATSGEDAGQIVITKTLTIRGKTGAGSDILDAKTMSRIFKVENRATLFLENLKLTGGKAEGEEDADKCGGAIAIYASNAIVNITNCIITGNEAETNGGGIYVEGGTTNITNCIFTGNTAKNGGGIYMTDSSYAVVTISGGTIGGTGTGEANKATGSDGNGGGIYVGDRCDLRLQDYTDTDNDTHSVLIIGNQAAKGGGVYANYADVSMKEGTRIAVDAVNNDVYLYNTSMIKVFNTLTAEDSVARITVPDGKYLTSTKVLKGNITGGTPQNYTKFAVTPKGDEYWTVDSNGYLTKGKTAVFNNITKNQIEAAIAAASSTIYNEGDKIDYTALDGRLVLYMTKRNGHFNYGIMHVTEVDNGSGYIKFNYKTFRAYDSDVVLQENDKVVNGGEKFDLDTGNVNVNGSDFSLENTGQKRFKVLDYAKFYILSN